MSYFDASTKTCFLTRGLQDSAKAANTYSNVAMVMNCLANSTAGTVAYKNSESLSSVLLGVGATILWEGSDVNGREIGDRDYFLSEKVVYDASGTPRNKQNYETVNGNRKGTDDYMIYRGGGLMGITGRDNYITALKNVSKPEYNFDKAKLSVDSIGTWTYFDWLLINVAWYHNCKSYADIHRHTVSSDIATDRASYRCI